MKKHVLLLTGAALLSTSAFASKARMTALGQDAERGSSFYSDSRGVFGNPADLNEMKNFVVTEWGTSGAAADGEGGIFKEMGSFVYGIYLNSTTGQNDNGRAAAGFLVPKNRFDLFLAGDSGVQWGVRFYMGGAEYKQGVAADAANPKNSAMGLGLGASMGAMAFSANLDLSDKSEGNSTTVFASNKAMNEADMGMNLAFDYAMGDTKFSVGYASNGFSQTDISPTPVVNTSKTSEISIGAGKVHNISSTSSVVMDVAYTMSTTETNDGVVAGETVVKTAVNMLPLTFSFETEANSWLTYRGFIKQAFIIGTNTTETTVGTAAALTETNQHGSTASMGGGITLNYGKLQIDGVLATGGKVLNLDQLMGEVSASYWF